MLVGIWLMLGVCSFECTRVLHETLPVPVLMYESETMVWMEEERSRTTAVQMEKKKFVRY